MAAGHLGTRVAPHGRDELARLGHRFDDMAGGRVYRYSLNASFAYPFGRRPVPYNGGVVVPNGSDLIVLDPGEDPSHAQPELAKLPGQGPLDPGPATDRVSVLGVGVAKRFDLGSSIRWRAAKRSANS